MDMLQYFQEKMQIKEGFIELLNDIGISKSLFLEEGEVIPDDAREEHQAEIAEDGDEGVHEELGNGEGGEEEMVEYDPNN